MFNRQKHQREKIKRIRSKYTVKQSYERMLEKARNEEMKFEDYDSYILVNDKYTIFSDDEKLICSCPSYRWHKPAHTCKHIESLKIHNII